MSGKGMSGEGLSGRRPSFGVVIARNVMLPTRDGTQLATDLYRPARDGEPLPGPFPCVLTRTPYDKSAPLTIVEAEFWAKRGYVRAVQDVRGRFASQGDFYLLRDEGPDGYDSVEWLAAQPWCDGQVGLLGTSYMACAASAAACLNPPHLAALWLNQGGFNGLTSAVRQGGAFELRWLSWAFWNAPVSKEALADPSLAEELDRAAVEFGEWLGRLPLRPGESPLARVPHYERWALELYTHGLASEEPWSSTGFDYEAHLEGASDVPTVFSGGWYDSYARSTTEYFARASRAKRSPQQLLMGPWTHGELPLSSSLAGDVDLGAAAPVNGNLAKSSLHLRLAFFDRHLKAIDSEAEEPPVRLFVMGGGSGRRLPSGRLDHGGRWREEREWPLPRARVTPYYLHAGGALRAGPPAADGAAEGAQGGTFDSFTFDPSDPVPTVSAGTSSLSDYVPTMPELAMPLPRIARRRNMVLHGGADQRTTSSVFGAREPFGPLADRADVLVYETAPLENPLELTGPIVMRLWVSTSAVDTDFTAKLIDVYPPNEDYPAGYALNLTDSIKRLRFREGYDAERFVTPGEVVPLTIELYPTSNLFATGHRIRVDVSSSNFPRFDVNPNSGEPLGRHTQTVVAEQRIYHDAERPSRIELPLVPGD